MNTIFPFVPRELNIPNDGSLHCPHCGAYEYKGIPFYFIKQYIKIEDIDEYENTNQNIVLQIDNGTILYYEDHTSNRFDGLKLYVRTCPCCNTAFYYTYVKDGNKFFVFKTLEELENWITIYKSNEVPW